MKRMAVIDFETTGMSPEEGARPTEVAIVLLEDGRIVDHYQSLMNAGVRVPAFITDLTGISNAMVRCAPPVASVMADAARFVGDVPMVAHNASFDRKFWQAELYRLGFSAVQPFVCTVLLSRRLYPQAPNHRLGTLVEHFGLPRRGAAHRALADAEMASHLVAHIQHDLRTQHGIASPDHAFLQAMQKCSRAVLPRWLAQHSAAGAQPSP